MLQTQCGLIYIVTLRIGVLLVTSLTEWDSNKQVHPLLPNLH